MNATVFKVIRIIFGILLVVFGASKFFDFMPPPEEAIPEPVMNYMVALSSTKTMELVGLVEVVSGLAFIFNKFGGLMAVILMSVSVNAVLFHVFLGPADIAGAAVLLLLNIVMLFGYKAQYKPMFN